MGEYLRRGALAALLLVGSGVGVSAQVLGDYVIVPASEIGSRAVVGRARADRRVVSPFPADRRVVVRPAGVVDTSPATARALPAPVPEPLAGYVNIGPLEVPSPVLEQPVPEAQYIDIGPYSAPNRP